MTASADPNETAGQSLTTHWHIKTTADPTTPPYPHEEALHIYLTACAKSLKSASQGKDYDLTQFSPEIVNCERCLIWLSWKADDQGIDLRAADPDTNNKGTNTSQSSPKDNQPSHDYLRKEIIKAGLACSNMLDELIDESEVFYEYCEAVADKVMLMLENESIL